MKQAKAIAYLRQLCCLGLGKDVVIPEFLEAVKDVIPSGNNLTTQLDENCVPFSAIINHITPEVIQTARTLIPTYHTSERTRQFLAVFQRDGFITEAFYGDDNFFNNDFYNLVWVPCEQHYLILVPIYVNLRLVELLWLYRTRFEKPFTLKEQQLALQLAPYVAHAIQQRPDEDVEHVYCGDSSLIVADCQGHIVYLSHTAQRMLLLATHLEQYKQGWPVALRLPP